MRDGVRLAVDVYAPPGARGAPTILRQSRYFRSVSLPRALQGFDALALAAEPTRALRERFVAEGYAWVDVCVRGSGASFGSRPHPWSPDEVRDGAEIVDWIIAQPWSNGLVGGLGTSYGGTCSEMLLLNRHPAVRAIAPRFALYDVYADVAFPGGLHLSWFTEAWSRFNAMLDRNDLAGAYGEVLRLSARGYRTVGDRRRAPLVRRLDSALGGRVLKGVFSGLLRGVRPVDDDHGRGELLAALQEHTVNQDVHAGALKASYRDDTGLSDAYPDRTIDAFSPHAHVADAKASGAAIYSYSGWHDGAYHHAATKRHRRVGTPGSRLLLGPWDHGGKQNTSPFEPARKSRFDHAGELVRFFDEQLRPERRQENHIPPVRYFTLGRERWRLAQQWPPPEAEPMTWHVDRGRRLASEGAVANDFDRYEVDLGAGTGHRARWNSLLGTLAPVGYGNREGADARLLSYTSDPLRAPLEVTGNPRVHIWLAAPTRDTAVFVYLEEVAPDGRVTMMTEGQLRAVHRAFEEREGSLERTFSRAEARDLEPGMPVELVIELLPLSYEVPARHRLRLAIAGADKDHFAAVPDAPPRFDVMRGPGFPSRIVLPVIP